MAIIVNNKTYRNLEEQVAYLTDIIGEATDVVKEVVAIMTTPPTTTTGYKVGDTIAVGASSPYSYYTLMLNNDKLEWVNIGVFPKQGNDGADGKGIYNGSGAGISKLPNYDDRYLRSNKDPEMVVGDLYIVTDDLGNCNTGDVLKVISIVEVSQGTSNAVLQFAYSSIGPQGEQGATGATGPQGEPGAQGEPGPAGKDGTDGKSALLRQASEFVYMANEEFVSTQVYNVGDTIIITNNSNSLNKGDILQVIEVSNGSSVLKRISKYNQNRPYELFKQIEITESTTTIDINDISIQDDICIMVKFPADANAQTTDRFRINLLQNTNGGYPMLYFIDSNCFSKTTETAYIYELSRVGFAYKNYKTELVPVNNYALKGLTTTLGTFVATNNPSLGSYLDSVKKITLVKSKGSNSSDPQPTSFPLHTQILIYTK